MSEQWLDSKEIKKALVEDGWRSPDTYDNFYCTAPLSPAVYLFLLHDVEKEFYSKALVAYVGMSVQLACRWHGHEILNEISVPGYWPMRWFKPTPERKLRQVERKYIQKFDPAWNVIGRTRGVALQ
ncbi:hypothetical protein [Roseovarius indicus]|uniref:Uncharacterized protein n=1 Tax=Roseovarius indicus TaxID=540747 RepID=A0A0T5P9J7_9RHOB|nr:hypothetical protein [Roseovarius indicus]KRS17518.1 hypothetical protein XM52_13630 [Roseovarius indicus]QEW26721.1 hypothetical protein RIdsm_02523 [Roseovarius indicus]SFD61102.1 hypothetical protein SAMN04488031_101819 [Roseovarius indicus]